MSGSPIETVVVTADTFQNTAAVECFIDVYPFESETQDVFQIHGGDIISCMTRKSVREDNGTFRVILAPEVVGANLSRGQTLTPMSTAVIGMRRGKKASVVMVGLITEINEEQTWIQDEGGNRTVRRVTIVTGVDLAYYFTMIDYYSLWILAVTGNTLSDSGLAAGLLTGEPSQVGQQWYQKVMSDQGVFKDTVISYKTGRIKFPQIFGTQFEMFDFSVPYGDYFLTSSGSWMDRFRMIFPFPFYEFFVTTNFSDAFPGASGGTSFSTIGIGDQVSSTVSVIARINPLPQLKSSVSNGSTSFDSIDTSRWQQLQAFTLDVPGFIDSDVSFNENEIYNFYVVNPLWLTGQNGDDNANIKQPLMNFATVLDQGSIARYGYRPLMQPVLWFSDITGAYAQQHNSGGGSSNNSSVQQLMATLLGRVAGYYEASPLMLKGTVTTWLRPDIEVGCKLTYQPYRNNQNWDFYITGVTHTFVFGGQSQTQITIDRGLPSDVYNDNASSGLLFNIHIGNAQRVDGQYQTGNGGLGNPLRALSRDQFQQLIAQMTHLYITPQATTPQQGAGPGP